GGALAGWGGSGGGRPAGPDEGAAPDGAGLPPSPEPHEAARMATAATENQGRSRAPALDFGRRHSLLMPGPIIHIIGAGLAGLAAAVRLAATGARIRIYEATDHAGGRCRSYFEPALGTTIDNGNHLLLSGNRAALGYLRAIGAEHELVGPAQACFDFADLTDKRRWRIAIN